jgi:ubiquinone/menaquinone biosynthesis C-methylase UbiE
MFRELDLTGVDVSGEMIRKAHRNLKDYRAELLKGELAALDLPAGGYDKIICTEVLEHVVDPTTLLEHIQRLLKPDGRVVITFPNDHLINGLKQTLHRSGLTRLPPFQDISWGGDRYHLHVWRIQEMRALLSRYFSIETVRFAPSRFLPIRCCFLCSLR